MYPREFSKNKVIDSLKNYMNTRRRTIDVSNKKNKDSLEHNNSYNKEVISKINQSSTVCQEDKLGLFTDPTSNLNSSKI